MVARAGSWLRGSWGVLATTMRRGGAAQAASEREQFLRAVLEADPDAIITIDQRGIIFTFNRAAERLFGYSAAEVIGRNVKMLMPPTYREHHDGYLANYLRTGEKRIIGIGRIVAGQRKDGGSFPMELAVGEIVLGHGRMFAGFVRDITEKQQIEMRLQELQEQVVQVSRLSALGELSAAIAHELNQPLSAIMNYVEAGRHLAGADDAASRARVTSILDKVVGQATRAGEVIRRLRALLEKQQIERAAEDINKVVEEAHALALIGARNLRIHVTLDLAYGLERVWIDRIQIQQVVINLVRNAVEVLAGTESRELTLRTGRTAAGEVLVLVADTGPGVAAEVAPRLFQPFVTTKRTGMGIGLSISRSLVEAHGGRLWHEPNPGGGTIFAFTLPARRPDETSGG